ncbi:hypothetical protein FKO01_51725 [Mesorhizobium sp. B2-3-3]|nr:hypothetical protein FKO01_51725 [Mesorhizobium sp. B2-3-3]
MQRTSSESRFDTPGAIVNGVFFAIMLVVFFFRLANEVSPIRSVDTFDATIKTVYWGKDHGTTYALSLKDNSLVLVDDEEPHLIGSNTRIERVTRDNGSVSYRFPK